MSNSSFNGASALLSHLLGGNKVTKLEAMLLFGIQNPASELTRFRKAGYILESSRTTMIKVLRRLNEFSHVTVPSNLPSSEIRMTEYWIAL